jgi:hypothetical protein
MMKTIALLALLTACGETKDTSDTAAPGTEPPTTDSSSTETEGDSLAIVGVYIDSWGTDHDIGEATWTQAAGSTVFHITQYDNAEAWVVAENDAANDWNAGLWSRFDWTWDGDGRLWYCQVAYDATSEDAALTAAAPDPSDPGASGCGGFSWTELIPQ